MGSFIQQLRSCQTMSTADRLLGYKQCWNDPRCLGKWSPNSSPEHILIYFECTDTFGKTELSFSSRIRKSLGLQGCTEDLRVASKSLLIFYFNNRLQQLIFQQQTATALLLCFVLILFWLFTQEKFSGINEFLRPWG